jgi:N6-L-threonylcarbamoyladenine synthase
MKDHFDYEVIGQTKDDAAGEAFDKGAKILGLGYPGGPIIASIAERGDENKVAFPLIDLTPHPTRNLSGFLEKPELSMDFSFSGLKTALINKVRGQEDYRTEDLAASFQKAIVENLAQNVIRAVNKYQPKTFILSGGVAANKMLRERLEKEIKVVSPNTKYITPEPSLCTDNAAMIASVTYWRVKTGKANPTLDFSAEPNLELG